MFVKTLKYIMYFGMIMLVLSACSGTMDGMTASASPAETMQRLAPGGELITAAVAGTAGLQSPAHVNVTYSPGDGEQQVSVNLPAVIISFDRPVDVESVSLQSLSISPAVNAAIDKQELATSNSVSFAMLDTLEESTSYTLVLSGIRDFTGIEIPPTSWQFVTGANVANTTDTTPPTVPENLRTIGLPTAYRVNLAWTASADNIAVTGYSVIRDGVFIASVTRPAFVDRTVAENTIYQYAVQAYDAAGNVATSDIYTLNTSPVGNTGIPPAPANVRYSILTNAQVTIHWNASNDGTGDTSYRVYRDAIQLASTSSTFYTDSTVTAGADYRYLIVALGHDGNYAISEPFDLNIPPLHDKTATISWSNPVRNDDATCTPGIEHNLLFYGTSSGNYTREHEIDLFTDASCVPAQYDEACNMPVTECRYRTAELAADTWYLALQALDRLGYPSSFSNEITALIH